MAQPGLGAETATFSSFCSSAVNTAASVITLALCELVGSMFECVVLCDLVRLSGKSLYQ